jgi:hypothetical protein
MKAKLVIFYEVFAQEYLSKDIIEFDCVTTESWKEMYDEWKMTHVNKVRLVYAVIDYIDNR